MKRKREGCGAGAQSARVCMRGRWLRSIYVHICVDPWRREGWRRDGEGGGGSKEMAGEGQDEEMGDGRGGRWLVEGKGRR